MKKTVMCLLVCAMSAACFAPVYPQGAQAERRLEDASSGYSFAAPAGFDAQQSNEGFALVNRAQTVAVLVTAHNHQTFREFAAQANLERDGLKLAGQVQDFGQGGKSFRATKQTDEGLGVVDTFVLFSPHGGGVLVVAISKAANERENSEAARRVAESVAFSKPRESELGKQLEAALGGKQLIYLYTASGYSEREDIFLCPSGRFVFRGDASSLSNSGSAAVGSDSEGNWKVSTRGGPTLVLQFRNGSVREHKISARQASNEIGLDGKRYFVKPFNDCPR
jgi:hypothetical protein